MSQWDAKAVHQLLSRGDRARARLRHRSHQVRGVGPAQFFLALVAHSTPTTAHALQRVLEAARDADAGVGERAVEVEEEVHRGPRPRGRQLTAGRMNWGT